MNDITSLFSGSLSTYDIFRSLIVFSGLETIPIKRETINNVLYQLRKQKGFSNLLDKFSFSQSDAYPYSRLAMSALDTLLIDGLITISGDTYYINAELTGVEKQKYLKRFDDNIIGQLKLLAQNFRELISQQSP